MWRLHKWLFWEPCARVSELMMSFNICENLRRYFWLFDGTVACGDYSFGHGRCVWVREARMNVKSEFNGVRCIPFVIDQKKKIKDKQHFFVICLLLCLSSISKLCIPYWSVFFIVCSLRTSCTFHLCVVWETLWSTFQCRKVRKSFDPYWFS